MTVDTEYAADNTWDGYGGNSQFPIRYNNGIIGYDFEISRELQQLTCDAFDYLDQLVPELVRLP